MREGISVHDAIQSILVATEEPLESVEVPLAAALGHALAGSVASERLLPPSDNSAMDGYAVRVGDLVGATPATPVDLQLVDEIAAGGLGSIALKEGQAARIFTGAPVPESADTVVRQEDTENLGDVVRIGLHPQPGAHIRRAGEDIRPGEELLADRCVIGPPEVGVLASVGRARVRVHRRPRVAILSGGNELVPVDGDISGGRIVASNSYTLSAASRLIGAEPIDLGISRDTAESVEEQFTAALDSDCIVSSAGVSVGDHDHVRPVLEKLGCRLEFWGVRMKPGYPLAFGRFGSRTGASDSSGPLVFGLPGNPVSASVCFQQFVRPALLRLMGHEKCFPPTLRARSSFALSKKAGRLHFVRVRLEEEDGEWLASSTGNQSSGVMTSLTRADGLMIFPEDETELRVGDPVLVQLLDARFPSREHPGLEWG
jgi:molybdopterin molybdotransferase